MKKDGYDVLDIIGFHGYPKKCFDNIIVDRQNKLWIIDVTLFEAKSS